MSIIKENHKSHKTVLNQMLFLCLPSTQGLIKNTLFIIEILCSDVVFVPNQMKCP